ncbi:hypothetical protein LBBP_00135 [Leptospira borgpetersenii serovar Ballum]|uniref:Uncharacterized protein n=1 Tax=Leptospira borgpetersenii serovar Ballum TaxID=280505 RepID=A0A0S2ILG7_LEPBO|nr:hypothetical protein LBBP_00135 [Leptospira borgpetersenii serovar Ballum]
MSFSLGGGETQPHCSLWVAKRGGGKIWEIFLYHKIILFASKKSRSCRNTWKNMRFRFLLLQFNLWGRSAGIDPVRK